MSQEEIQGWVKDHTASLQKDLDAVDAYEPRAQVKTQNIIRLLEFTSFIRSTISFGNHSTGVETMRTGLGES